MNLNEAMPLETLPLHTKWLKMDRNCSDYYIHRYKVIIYIIISVQQIKHKVKIQSQIFPNLDPIRRFHGFVKSFVGRILETRQRNERTCHIIFTYVATFIWNSGSKHLPVTTSTFPWIFAIWTMQAVKLSCLWWFWINLLDGLFCFGVF